MRRLLGAVALLILVTSFAAAQSPIVISNSVPSFPILSPNGTCAAPSYSFSSQAGTGIARTASSQIDIALGGACYFTLTTTALLPVTDNVIALGDLSSKRLSTVNVATGYYSGNSQMTDGAGNLLVASVGPHAIGGAAVTTAMLTLQGTFAGAAAGANGFVMNPTLTPAANGGATVYNLTPTITPATSGTHATLIGNRIAPTFTGGAASNVTNAEAQRIVGTFAAPANTTTARGLHITGSPTGATNNYSMEVAAGISRFTFGTVIFGSTDPATALSGSIFFSGVAFASLGTPSNGTMTFCTDCDPPTLVDSTCTSAGTKTGSLAFRVNGAWKCLG